MFMFMYYQIYDLSLDPVNLQFPSLTKGKYLSSQVYKVY